MNNTEVQKSRITQPIFAPKPTVEEKRSPTRSRRKHVKVRQKRAISAIIRSRRIRILKLSPKLAPSSKSNQFLAQFDLFNVEECIEWSFTVSNSNGFNGAFKIIDQPRKREERIRVQTQCWVSFTLLPVVLRQIIASTFGIKRWVERSWKICDEGLAVALCWMFLSH